MIVNVTAPSTALQASANKSFTKVVTVRTYLPGCVYPALPLTKVTIIRHVLQKIRHPKHVAALRLLFPVETHPESQKTPNRCKTVL